MEPDILSIRHHETTQSTPLPSRFIVDMTDPSEGPAQADPRSKLPVFRGIRLPNPDPPMFFPSTPYQVMSRYCSPPLLTEELRTSGLAATHSSSPTTSNKTSTDLTYAVAKNFRDQFPHGFKLQLDLDMIMDLNSDLEDMLDPIVAHQSVGRSSESGIANPVPVYVAQQIQTITEERRYHAYVEILEDDQTGAVCTGPLVIANSTLRLQSLFKEGVLPTNSLQRPGYEKTFTRWSHADRGQEVMTDLQSWIAREGESMITEVCEEGSSMPAKRPKTSFSA